MQVKILADSVNPFSGVRLTTFHLIYPQTIHQQVLTHRAFSRNSSSLRAISFKRSLEFNTVYPMWTKEKRGMVGERFDITDEKDREVILKADALVKELREMVEATCLDLHDLGIHHQDINDYLRPFQNIHTVVTATEWKNWFDLRLPDDAKPAIQTLAREMFIELTFSKPEETSLHVPVVYPDEKENYCTEDLFLLSGRRCARISYLTDDKPAKEDIQSAKRMIAEKHLSPFEHQALAVSADENEFFANFRSWRSFRNLKGY